MPRIYVKLNRKAYCHPDRPHQALGMCWQCYNASRAERIRECARARYHANLERSRAYLRNKYRQDPEKAKRRYKKYRESHRESVALYRWAHNLRTYGMTPEQYERLLKKQRGVCAICGRPPGPGHKKRLCADHDHEKNKNRGLLCDACNRALGNFGDSIETLQRAIEYLLSWKEVK